jgi:SAM-dependent methyltransferase
VEGGKARYCPVCRSTIERFEPANDRSHSKCSACGALDHHRFLGYLLDRLAPIVASASMVLDIVPNEGIRRQLEQLVGGRYVGLDCGRPGPASLVGELTQLPFSSGTFDLVVCSAALEDGPDDRFAMLELARVLTPRGLLLFTARAHSRTIDERLGAFGLEPTRIAPEVLLPSADLERCGVGSEPIFLCRRSDRWTARRPPTLDHRPRLLAAPAAVLPARTDRGSAVPNRRPAESPALPTFLVIGAMKSGTTSLHRYLEQHPEVSMSAEKELDFFLGRERWDYGPSWYASHFAHAAGAGAVGESSPNYTKRHAYEGVPERIAAMLPEVRLIYCLRDPIDRIRSHYLHRSSTHSVRPFRDEIFADPNYVLTSSYAYQLEPYLRLFDEDRILLITAECLRADRQRTMERVYEFIGVDPERGPSLNREFHRTSAKEVRVDGAEVTDEVRGRLAELLEPDVARLRPYMDADFDGWNIDR